jgi:hypothetical protein
MVVAIQLMATGKRVRNTYTTYPELGHSPPKGGLIPHRIVAWHQAAIKAQAVLDGCAAD